MSRVAQVQALSRRSILGTWRQPTSWIPGLFFPLMLAAVYSAQFAKAIDLPAFPEVDSFLQFILPASVLQGVAFGANNGASDLAVDIENGFIDRLLASPVPRTSILLGRLAGAAAFGGAQAVVLTAIFVVFGAPIEGGLGAVAVLVAMGVLLGLGIGSLGCALALRTGSQEAVQSTFPLIFVSLFVSSAFFPASLMEGWYGSVARHNPITWMIDPVRRLVVEGFAWSDAGTALAVPAAITAVGVTVAYTQLGWRLRRA